MRILYITNVNMKRINGATEHIKGFIYGVRQNNGNIKHIHPLLYGIEENNKIVQLILFNVYSIIAFLKNKKKCDIVYIRYSPFLILPLFNKFTDRKIILELNGAIDIEADMIFRKGFLVQAMMKFILFFCIAASDYTVTITNDLKKYYCKHFKIKSEKCLVQENAGYVNRLPDDVRTEFSRMGIITLSDNKWFDIEMIKRLKDELKEHNIVLEVYLSTADEERYKDTGFMLNKEFRCGNYDWGLLVYNEEAKRILKYGISPIKFFTYINCLIPVLSPSVSMIDKYINNYDTGVIYGELQDYKEIIKTILSVYKDKQEWIVMQESCREMILNSYNWTANAGKVMDLI